MLFYLHRVFIISLCDFDFSTDSWLCVTVDYNFICILIQYILIRSPCFFLVIEYVPIWTSEFAFGKKCREEHLFRLRRRSIPCRWLPRTNLDLGHLERLKTRRMRKKRMSHSKPFFFDVLSFGLVPFSYPPLIYVHEKDSGLKERSIFLLTMRLD